MAFVDHLTACNSHDPSGFLAFHLGPTAVGQVRRDFAQALACYPDLISTDDDGVHLALGDGDGDVGGRSARLTTLVDRLVADGLVPKPRGEAYPVLTRWGAPPLARIDRAAVPYFGIPAYGLHVNGFVRTATGAIRMWVARRARDRSLAPGKLDNMIAGGQPIGLSVRENLIKEAAEEASVPAEVAARAVAVGALGYVMDVPHGVRPDTLFLFDLELDPSFEPANRDGEVEAFTLMPLEEVTALVRDGFAFKFNCSLVVIDFLIRHGVLDAEHPEYLTLVHGLHRGT